MGGQEGIRGYLVQTLIALVESLADDDGWDQVTLEPDHRSNKIDVIWVGNSVSRAFQIKSSQNRISRPSAERWAKELEESQSADEYVLLLVGPCAKSVVELKRVGNVSIPTPENLNLKRFIEVAAHRLDRFLKAENLATGTADNRELLASALVGKLAELSSSGTTLTRGELVQQLRDWIATGSSGDSDGRDQNVRFIRLFVSSPSELPEERAALGSVVSKINGSLGAQYGIRIVRHTFENGTTQQDQAFNTDIARDDTLAQLNLFVGILAYRFGDPNGPAGSGTQLEFRNVVASFMQIPDCRALLFFSCAKVDATTLDLEKLQKVNDFRKSISPTSVCSTHMYEDTEAFAHQLYTQLRKMIIDMAAIRTKSDAPLAPPSTYLRWLRTKANRRILHGLKNSGGRSFTINAVYVPLTTLACNNQNHMADVIGTANDEHEPVSPQLLLHCTF